MIIALALLGYLILFLLFLRFLQVATYKTPQEQAAEDEEQMRYLSNLRKK